jgi:hypothetical protein
VSLTIWIISCSSVCSYKQGDPIASKAQPYFINSTRNAYLWEKEQSKDNMLKTPIEYYITLLQIPLESGMLLMLACLPMDDALWKRTNTWLLFGNALIPWGGWLMR